MNAGAAAAALAASAATSAGSVRVDASLYIPALNWAAAKLGESAERFKGGAVAGGEGHGVGVACQEVSHDAESPVITRL